MMKTKIKYSLKRSLFLKILLVFIVSYIIIIFISIFSHRVIFQKARSSRIPSSHIENCRYMSKDIGIPPDTLRAREIVNSSNDVQIRIENDSIQWESHQNLPLFDELSFDREFQIDSNIRAGYLKSRKGHTVELIENENRFLFLFVRTESDQLISAALQLNIVLTLFSAVIITCVYFLINYFLKPIRTLHEGIEYLRKGNLDFQVRTNRIDELGQLIDSYNLMTRRIREMIFARDQLLLDVSHELRSPLTRIKFSLEFLKDESTKQSIGSDISEMETMIRELLETERLNSPYGVINREQINIGKLVKDVVQEFHDQQPGIKLLSFPEELFLDIEEKRIHILLKNVIDNALKYSEEKGNPVEISLQENQDEIVVSVQDFGSGIPEKDIPYIFEPFYRVDKSRSKETGGYGLGMSLSKKIMEAHGGRIEIASKLNIGTTVSLIFNKM